MATPQPTTKKYTGFILFERGYRPFFLGAALFAGIAIPLWVLALKTGYEIPTGFSARDYHVHEMIFGYLSAILAGFLLTAMPNWTNRPAIDGLQLAFLSTLWLTGRIAIVTSASWPMTAAVIDAAFLLIVCGVAWREVIKGGSIRNMPICLLVSLFAIANIAYHFAQLEGGDTAVIERSALGVITVLISLVGGRVIPNFSGNWMKKNKLTPLPAPFGTFDKAALLATVVTLASWIMTPDTKLTGALFSALCLIHAVRLYRWRGWQTTAEPLVFILHIGYLWLPVWYGLTGLAILLPEAFSTSSALHALTTGTIGTMTMAIMTRAILGHSGRQLHAGRATQLIYTLIVSGAFLRIFSETLPVDYITMVSLSGALWAGGFIVFALVYGPYCLARKI